MSRVPSRMAGIFISVGKDGVGIASVEMVNCLISIFDNVGLFCIWLLYRKECHAAQSAFENLIDMIWESVDMFSRYKYIDTACS